MGDNSCGSGDGQTCATNLGWIHLRAGDLVGAYRSVKADAELGDRAAIELIIEVCERAEDAERADGWRARLG